MIILSVNESLRNKTNFLFFSSPWNLGNYCLQDMFFLKIPQKSSKPLCLSLFSFFNYFFIDYFTTKTFPKKTFSSLFFHLLRNFDCFLHFEVWFISNTFTRDGRQPPARFLQDTSISLSMGSSHLEYQSESGGIAFKCMNRKSILW